MAVFASDFPVSIMETMWLPNMGTIWDQKWPFGTYVDLIKCFYGQYWQHVLLSVKKAYSDKCC